MQDETRLQKHDFAEGACLISWQSSGMHSSCGAEFWVLSSDTVCVCCLSLSVSLPSPLFPPPPLQTGKQQVVRADAYVAALDVPGAQRLLPQDWRRFPQFDNIYKLVGVPVITVQLR